MADRGVRCRGVCKAGHTTEAVAEPGRVTWHGTCATEGCELKVYCRRVPADIPPAPVDTQVAADDPHRVLEVPGYRDDPEPPAEPNDAGEPIEQPAAGPPDPGAVDGPKPDEAAPPAPRRQRRASGPARSPAPPTEPAPPRPQRPRGIAARLRARLADDATDEADERVFGVW